MGTKNFDRPIMEEIFTTVELPIAGKCEIIEGRGRHYFKALILANGNAGLIMKYLMMELCVVKDKKLSESDLDGMHIRDISYVSEVIATMMSNDLIL